MSIHLQLDGAWAECATPANCDIPIHQDMSLDELRHIPAHVFTPLLETLGSPPVLTYVTQSYFSSKGKKSYRDVEVLEWRDEQGRCHRDYGLPARQWPHNGRKERWQHGQITHANGVPFRSNIYPAKTR